LESKCQKGKQKESKTHRSENNLVIYKIAFILNTVPGPASDKLSEQVKTFFAGNRSLDAMPQENWPSTKIMKKPFHCNTEVNNTRECRQPKKVQRFFCPHQEW